MTWLTEHYTTRKALADNRERALPAAALRQQVAGQPPARDFRAALQQADGPAVIAEIKYRSPSQGRLRDGDDVEQVAHSYAEAGASCLSVLIDDTHFDGSLRHLTRARQAVDLPALAKGFLTTPYEVLEARAAGADAVLLIATCLAPETLAAMHTLATDLGMAALVEVHDEADLARLDGVPVTLVGVNHRNLATLDIDMQMSARLAPQLPKNATTVAESGLNSLADITAMQRLGYDAVLMGTRFMATPNPGDALREVLTGQDVS